ncbi:MAG: hypothetical protein HQK54_06195 [Oligoflexales bacterium]|nr:hypothetical protein [Oligoflexales bacterium]
MDLMRWDRDAREVISDISALERKVQARQKQEKRILLGRKYAVAKYHVAVERLVEKFFACRKKREDLPPKLSALIHWSVVQAENTFKLYKRKSEFLGEVMWQHLIKSRMSSDKDQVVTMADDNDLIKISTRHNHLRKVEMELSEKLVELRKTKESLVREYEKYQAHGANVSAAASFQTSLRSEGRHRESSVDKSFGNYLRRLTLHVRGMNTKDSHIRNLQEDLYSRVGDLARNCRDWIVGDNGVVHTTIGDAALSNIEFQLEKIEEMREQLRYSYQENFYMNPPDLKPAVRIGKPRP